MLSLLLSLPDSNEIQDMAVVLLDEQDDLSAVEDTLVALFDEAINPEAVVPPPGGQLLEMGSDMLIGLLVHKAVQAVATPEKRQAWIEKRRENVRKVRKWVQDGPERRQARRAGQPWSASK